jgi:hypothetical protein
VLDLREVLSDFDNAQPPEALRQRVMRDAAEVFATGRRGGNSTTNAGTRRRRPVAWVAAGLGAALALGLLAIAAHSRDADHASRPSQPANHRPPRTFGGGATVLPAGPRPRPLDTQVRYQTPSGFTPEVHLSVPPGWYGYANAHYFSVGKGLRDHFYTDGLTLVWRIDQPFATTVKAFRRLHGLTITARKPASVGGHTGLTFAITVPASPIDLFGAAVPDGHTRATLLDFDGTTVMINVGPSHDRAGRAEQRGVIQSFSFPP